jgi:hypothetical protein
MKLLTPHEHVELSWTVLQRILEKHFQFPEMLQLEYDTECNIPKVTFNPFCEKCDPATGVSRNSRCVTDRCFDCNFDDGSCTIPRDPTCHTPEKPSPGTVPTQHAPCNEWKCESSTGSCIFVGNAARSCTGYQYPLDAKPKDPQCWQPLCVLVGSSSALSVAGFESNAYSGKSGGSYGSYGSYGSSSGKRNYHYDDSPLKRDYVNPFVSLYPMGECQGIPKDIAPQLCPVPPGVSIYCYVPQCVPGTGYCSTVPTYTSDGGIYPGDSHRGNCPIPAEYDA